MKDLFEAIAVVEVHDDVREARMSEIVCNLGIVSLENCMKHRVSLESSDDGD